MRAADPHMIRNAGNGKLWIGIVQPDELERFVVVICVAGNDMFLVVLDKQGKELVKMAEQGALLCCAIEVEACISLTSISDSG